MNALRNIVEVNNKKITINLPDNFLSKKVEIIVLPYEEKDIKQKNSLSEFFKNSPLSGSEIDLTRNDDLGREVLL